MFGLFVLSARGFDRLAQTVPWINLFWADTFNILAPLVGKPPVYF